MKVKLQELLAAGIDLREAGWREALIFAAVRLCGDREQHIIRTQTSVAVPVELLLGGVDGLAIDVDRALFQGLEHRFDAGIGLDLEPALRRDIDRIGRHADGGPDSVFRAVAQLQPLAFGLVLGRLRERAHQLDRRLVRQIERVLMAELLNRVHRGMAEIAVHPVLGHKTEIDEQTLRAQNLRLGQIERVRLGEACRPGLGAAHLDLGKIGAGIAALLAIARSGDVEIIERDAELVITRPIVHRP